MRVLAKKAVSAFRALAIVAAVLGVAPSAYALQEEEPLHWSGHPIRWDRKNNIVELGQVGGGGKRAVVNQPGETLVADYIRLNLKDRSLEAKGNCVYASDEMMIEGEEMAFDLTTRTGSILRGRMTGDGFSLTGDRINKLSGVRYQTHNATYTTCQDCPESWSIVGEDVDLTFGGYALIRNAKTKVLGAPVLWSPFLAVPLKTQRQTGFLFPKFGNFNRKFTFVQPFFWAISRWADMTIAPGVFVGMGPRLEWEGRYQITPRSGGKGQFFYLRDPKFGAGPNRWGLYFRANQELPWGFEAKLRIEEVSDIFYPAFLGDVPGAQAPTIASDFSLNGSSKYVSGYIAARRYRNLLYFENPTGFDLDTVQMFPRAELTSKDRLLFGLPIGTGLSVEVVRFTRGGDPYDLSPDLNARATDAAAELVDPEPGSREAIPGVDPIREANRFTLRPRIYASFVPWKLFAVVPSLEYRSFIYTFEAQQPTLVRGYLLFRTDLTTQFERVYKTKNEDFPRIKHLIRPTLTYSLIPFKHETQTPGGHPFLNQMAYSQELGVSGFNFDNNDIIPIDSPYQNYSNYFFPIGNAVAYGVISQMIRRNGKMGSEETPTYQRVFEVSGKQSVNFRELFKETGEKKPLSNVTFGMASDSFGLTTDATLTYIPYIPIIDEGPVRNQQSPWVLNLTSTYVLSRGLRQRVLAFERSFTMSYSYQKLLNSATMSTLTLGSTFSINDYFMPRAGITYNFATDKLHGVNGGIRIQGSGQCWYVDLNVNHALCPGGNEGYCTSFQPTFQMNFTGAGFSGISEFATSIVK